MLEILKECHFKYNKKSERVIVLKKVSISMLKESNESKLLLNLPKNDVEYQKNTDLLVQYYLDSLT